MTGHYSEDLLFKLALMHTPLIGSTTARRLIDHCGSAKEVFQTRPKALAKIPGIGTEIVRQIRSANSLKTAEDELAHLERYGVQVLYHSDDAYPERLRHLPDSPLLLYYKGTANLNHERIVSIVGTRKPSDVGLATVERLVEELAAYQPLIVSGLALGIDVAAHRAALQYNTPTLGVLGHGLRHIYPSQHKKTAEAMLENGGLLSEYPFFSGPEREHFPMRNRVVAGMSDAVIVVESAKKGGSMITVQFAANYHREVLAVPGRLRDPLAEGCNWLIKTNQATLLESAEDVAYLLNWGVVSGVAAQLSLFEGLDEDEKKVLALLHCSQPTHVDALNIQSGIPMGILATVLLELEFKGLIRNLPGKMYLKK